MIKLNILITILLLVTPHSLQFSETIPTPTTWPERFHALLYMNLSSHKLQITNLWYDWPRGLNVNIIQKQLGVLLYDVEWNNGTTFYYTLGENGSCEAMQSDVGIPRPDFLDGAHYLGTRVTEGFLCNVWNKVDVIWYYEDVLTKRPVRWDFYDGISTHVITFEVGAVLHDPFIQAPSYCFSQDSDTKSSPEKWWEALLAKGLEKIKLLVFSIL